MYSSPKVLKIVNFTTEIMDNLLKIAKLAADSAYAPHSGFRVGAAVMTASGEIVTGNNQEADSYSLTICAERVALAKLFSENPEAKATQIAVYTLNNSEGVVRPCGACREYIAQSARRCGIDIEVVMADRSVRISELLPLAFEL